MHVKLSRREAITVLAGAGVAMHGSKASAAANESLGAIAAANGFVFGAAAGPVIDKDIAYRELYTTHTRIVTTDIAMKMGTIAPQSGPKRFESADRVCCNSVQQTRFLCAVIVSFGTSGFQHGSRI